MLCPKCKHTLRVGKGEDIKKGRTVYRQLSLFCKTPGCPNNNGQPVYKDEVKRSAK